MLDWIGKPHKHINKPTWLQNIVDKKKKKKNQRELLTIYLAIGRRLMVS